MTSTVRVPDTLRLLRPCESLAAFDRFGRSIGWRSDDQEIGEGLEDEGACPDRGEVIESSDYENRGGEVVPQSKDDLKSSTGQILCPI